MQGGVIAFNASSGGHSGKNFGRYTIGLLHHVVNLLEIVVNGLCSKRSKAVLSRICQISDSDNDPQLYTATLATTQPTKLSKRSILSMASCVTVTSSNYHMFNIFLILSLP